MADDVETWLPIPGFEGFYEVSSRGRIKSLSRTVRAANPSREWTVRERIMTTGKTRKGYPSVTLCKEGKAYPREVHRLVCRAFHGEPAEGLQAAHNDGDKSNPSAANLRWATPSENSNDRRRHGTLMTGSQVPTSKLTDEIAIAAISQVAAGKSIKSSAREIGVSERVLRNIIGGTSWVHLSDHPVIGRAKQVIEASKLPKPTCQYGHPLSGENLVYNSQGQRACLQCRRRHNLACYHRNKRHVRAHLQEQHNAG